MTPRPPTSVPFCRAILAGVAILLASCGKKNIAPPDNSAVAPSDVGASPAVRASENGLEVAWWVVSDTDEQIGKALEPYLLRPLPIDSGVSALLEANGLRVVSIPLDAIDQVGSRLSLSGAIQRQWLGQSSVWTDAIAGPPWTRQRTIALDSGLLALGPGRMRLLARCWTVPVPVAPSERDPSPAAALHIELLLQHKEAVNDSSRLTLDPRDSSDLDALEAGLVFRRLAAEMTVSQGDAYLILPFAPGEPWFPTPNAAPDKSAENPTSSGLPDSVREAIPRLGEVRRGLGILEKAPDDERDSGSSRVGPPEAPVTSLGEALLMRQAAPTNAESSNKRGPRRLERPSRVVLIVIPRVPDRFRLIE